MRNAIAALLCVAMLGGCAAYDEYQFKHEAIEALGQHLFDPESAQFRDLHVIVREDTEYSLCGEINAKNRMGGFVGFHRFYVMAIDNGHTRAIIDVGIAQARSRLEDASIDGDPLFDASYADYCGSEPRK